MTAYSGLDQAYVQGLADVLTGEDVPSVVDPLSKASNFGAGNRPARELVAHMFTVVDPCASLVSGPVVRLHLPYAFGLLAFTLAGNDELAALRYYRPGATEYSDDGRTLSGAFGARLQGVRRGADQLSAIVQRLRDDPASRRTYATIVAPEDNLRPTREYPCAAGVQLFLRDGRLDLLTVMRAQQAFTVLPYDAFLFMGLQQVIAARLGLPVGKYRHFSGTFHVYVDELPAVEQTLAKGVRAATMPTIAAEGLAAEALMDRIVRFEREARAAAEAADTTGLRALASEAGTAAREPFERAIFGTLIGFALRKAGLDSAATDSDALVPENLRQLSLNL